MVRSVLMTLLMLSAVSFAGDRDEVELIGFSRAGDYAAYEIHGIADGSGFPYSEIFVIDIRRNVFSGGPFRVRGREGGSSDKESDFFLNQTRRQAKEKARAKLRALGIDVSRKGRLLVHHPRSDVGTDGKVARFVIKDDTINTGETQILKLAETSVSLPSCESLGIKPSLLELVLESEQTKRKTPLQKDVRIPESRGCAYDYRIESVHHHESGSLLVFVSYLRPGYEGPDRKYLAVSGKLP
jgi:predicted secreted protein